MSLHDVSMFLVLGEDPHQRSFIRAWLRAGGVHHRNVHTVEPPAGKGGGVKFVLERCRSTVMDAAMRMSRAQTRVIIAVDADDEACNDRFDRVRRAIGELDVGVAPADIACIIVPRRHIETWVQALGPPASSVDETASYKEKTAEEVKAAARALAGLTAPPTAPPSLVMGYEELRRFKAL